MADIRRVHGRQAETHQFPIQFAASPLSTRQMPVRMTRLLRTSGSLPRSAQEWNPLARRRKRRGERGGEGRGERRFQPSYPFILSSHVA